MKRKPGSLFLALVMILTVVSMGTVAFSENETDQETEAVTVPASDENLALNKPITCSKNETGFEVAMLVDGTLGGHWEATGGFPQWALIDLGEIYQINQTRLYPANFRAYQYKVEVSTDNINYSLAVDKTANTDEVDCLADAFDAIDARYVKLTVTGAYPSSYSGSVTNLHEFEVYGGDTALPPASTFIPIPSPTPAGNPSNFLKANGSLIRNNKGEGNNVVLCGVNVGGCFEMQSWMSPLRGAQDDWTAHHTLADRFGTETMLSLYKTFWDSFLQESDFQKIAAEGLNMIRLTIYYHDFMDETGNWRLKPDGTIDFSELDRVVATAAKYGIYTAICLCGVPGSQNGADHSGQQGETRVYDDPFWQDMTVKFWEGLAAHFNGNAAVAGYDLMNEPMDPVLEESGPKVFALHDRLYRAVRAVDPEHIIFINYIGPYAIAPHPSVYGWENVVYEIHDYVMTSNNLVKCANAMRMLYGIPVWLGEFKYSSAGEFSEALTLFTQEGISWSPWTYKNKSSNAFWGMYTGDGSTPNLRTESSDSIAAKWSTWDTDTHFTRVDGICDAMKAATSLVTLYHPTAADGVITPPETNQWYAKMDDFSAATHNILGDNNTGIVTVEFNVTPLANNMDSDVGFTNSSVTPENMRSFGPIIELGTNGLFTAMNRTGYMSIASVHYSAGNTYHVKMVADIPAKTYDVWVTPPGGTETMIADDYVFRETGPSITDIGKVTLVTGTADDDFYVSDLAVSSCSIDISDESNGGAGKVRTITIDGAEAESLTGKYLVVQYTAGAGTTAKISVVMIQATSQDVKVSYPDAGTKVDVWLTNGMPDLAGQDMGVSIYTHAATAAGNNQ